MKKIGLIDADSHNFPNLPLMKISAYHKRMGDVVEWWNGFKYYDIVYKSKVFDDTYTTEDRTPIKSDAIICGGSGYGTNNYLPDEIEHIYPDYSLYPEFGEAYGFLTRGCPRNCPFCIVTKKEGCKSCKVADLSEFWKEQKVIKLLDPNILACEEHPELLQQLINSNAQIDFTQGLDIRLVDKYNIRQLKKMRVKQFHFAWDNPKEDLSGRFIKFKQESEINYRKLGVYVLTNFNSTLDEDLHRIYMLRDIGYSPYVMVYNKNEAPRSIKKLQRWVNNRIIFGVTKKFEDYDEKLG